MNEPLRVLHVGLGPLGRRIVSDLHVRGLGTVAAAVDVDPGLAGRDLSELVPEMEPGVTISADPDLASVQGDVNCAVVTTRSDLRVCAPTFRALLERGLPVVSTCEELLWPMLRHPGLAGDLDRIARDHGGRLLGTGVNPGFLMDTLPLAASAVCGSVEAVRAWRIQDASDRRIPFQKKIGAGLTDEEFRNRAADGTLRHVGLGESLHFVADGLGLTIDRWEETLDPVLAERDLESDVGPIRAGTPSGVRQEARGIHDGRVLVELVFQAAVGQDDPHDRVLLEGERNIDLRIDGGVHGDLATSAITLNALPPLMAAPPGLHTMATIPLVHFRR